MKSSISSSNLAEFPTRPLGLIRFPGHFIVPEPKPVSGHGQWPKHLPARMPLSMLEMEVSRAVVEKQKQLFTRDARVQLLAPIQTPICDNDAHIPMRPCAKPRFFSQKLKKNVEFLSPLAKRGATILDATGSCTSFSGQPVEIHFVFDQKHVFLVADLAYMEDGRLNLVVHRKSTFVTKTLLAKIRYAQAMLLIHGIRFELKTERDVGGYVLDNAKKLLRLTMNGSSKIGDMLVEQTLERCGVVSLRHFRWDEPVASLAHSVAKLIIQGRVVLVRDEPLTAQSKVKLADDWRDCSALSAA